MTERITIEGSGLTVTHDQAKPDPKRIRPPRFAPSPDTNVRSPSGRTLDEMIDMPNWVIPAWALMAYTIFIAGFTVLLAVFT